MEFLTRTTAALILAPLRATVVTLESQYKLMTWRQLAILQWAYDYGLPRGFHNTMRAIAWQESSCGVRLHNPKDKGGGSWGIFGTSAKSAFHRIYGIETPHTEKDLRAVGEMLKENPDKAAEQCLLELEYWAKKRGRDRWALIWASYNAGNEFKNGEKYAGEILDKINFLRSHKCNVLNAERVLELTIPSQ